MAYSLQPIEFDSFLHAKHVRDGREDPLGEFFLVFRASVLLFEKHVDRHMPVFGLAREHADLHKTPLRDVMTEIERLYDVRVIFKTLPFHKIGLAMDARMKRNRQTITV